MRLFGQLPWFIATFASDSNEEDLARVTICFCWDSDVVAAARDSAGGTLVELVCMLPAWRGGTRLWTATQITEILEGRDRHRGGDLAFAFRTEGGQILSGSFLQVAGPEIADLASVVEIRASRTYGEP